MSKELTDEELTKLQAERAQARAESAATEFGTFLADLCQRHNVRMEIGLVIWGDFVEHPIRFVPV